jgi:hypothetical protein
VPFPCAHGVIHNRAAPQLYPSGPIPSVFVTDLNFPKAGPPAERSASPEPTNGALHSVLKETERQQSNWVVTASHTALPNRAALQLHFAQFRNVFSGLTLFLCAAKRARYRKYGSATLAP